MLTITYAKHETNASNKFSEHNIDNNPKLLEANQLATSTRALHLIID